MRSLVVVAAAWSVALLTGCSGGDAGGPTTYQFVTPAVNSQRVYSRAIVDDFHNSIDEVVSDTVTAVNPDGSYVVLEEDPSHDSFTVDGTTYAVTTEIVNVNDSGQETAYSYVAADGSSISCTLSPHGAGPDFPLTIGAAWTLDYTLSCGGNSPIAYTQVGSVVDVESVTVPAGTYMAVKLQSSISWTDKSGTIRTQAITNWRDVNTSLSVKEVISTSYSGTIPTTGYPVSTETLLQSES